MDVVGLPNAPPINCAYMNQYMFLCTVIIKSNYSCDSGMGFLHPNIWYCNRTVPCYNRESIPVQLSPCYFNLTITSLPQYAILGTLDMKTVEAVSYTHLTLPTICSV